ncbi:MAG TPA: ferredoxin [Acidimicrobiales bacterium]|nr:ferredoxin [Acidimicrobiales bacterium]
MKMIINTELCQGHNRCYALAPDLVEIDDLGYASHKGDGTVPPGREEAAQLAADNCPEEAITIIAD